MRIAFTIGSYRLHDFIRLSLEQLRKLAPDSPVLVSDDPSPETPQIQKLADSAGAAYLGARTRRGHFGADLQALVNALAFAETAKADVAVKISQRFIFRKAEAIDVIRKTFEDPNILVATPGQPKVGDGSRAAKGFGAFSILSDVVMIRSGALSPSDLLHLYRSRILRESAVPWASFIECAVDELHSQKFPGRTAKIEELTNPTEDPIYLRRYQASEQQYRDLALSHGWNGRFTTAEWAQIERQNYMCKPVVI